MRAAAPRYTTVGQLADGWLAAKAREGALSLTSYRSFVAVHVGWARDLPLEAALQRLRRWNQRTALRWWRSHLEEHDLAPRTAHAARHSFISALIASKADPVSAHAITHPGSLPPAAQFQQAARGSFRSYVHVSWDDRVRAIESLRLPAVEVTAEAQLSLDLGATTE